MLRNARRRARWKQASALGIATSAGGLTFHSEDSSLTLRKTRDAPREFSVLPKRLTTNTAGLIGIALTLLFVWLVAALKVQALFNQQADDALYLQNASNILRGEWLGAYNALTLVKGPGYPVFLAVCSVLRLPVLLAQALLYVGACTAFCAAVRPLLRNPASLLVLYALLLFNPVNFCLSRIMRDSFYTSLVLLVVACAVAIYVRRDQGLARGGRWWLFGLASSLGVALITREEGIWLVPCLLLVGIATAVAIARNPAFDRRRRVAELLILVVLLPLLTFAPTAAARALNRLAYKRFIVTEMTRPELADAVGALMRVKSAEQNQNLYVTTKTRERVYDVSPTFAELRGYFAARAEIWTCGGEMRKFTRACQGIGAAEIPGGWFVWALRSAAASSGFHESALKAAAFYHRVATEVNDACADGRLECASPRSSLVPPWQRQYPGLIARSYWRGIEYVAGFQLKTASSVAQLPSQSSGSDERDLELRIFRDEMAPLARQSSPASGMPKTGPSRLTMMDVILWCYQRVSRWGLGVAAMASLYLLIVSVLRRRDSDTLTVIFTLGVALLTRLGVIATVDALSFPAINEYYLAPAFPLALAFCFLTLHCLVEHLTGCPSVHRSKATGNEPSRGTALVAPLAGLARWRRGRVGNGASDTSGCGELQ